VAAAGRSWRPVRTPPSVKLTKTSAASAGRLVPTRQAAEAVIGGLLRAIGVVAALVLLVLGFLWLRDPGLPKPVVVAVAVVWGVGGTLALFAGANAIVERLPERAARGLTVVVFIGPALVVVGYFLVVPTLRTLATSTLDRNGVEFVGLANFVAVFTDRAMQEALRNNLLWIAVGATGSVLLGLVIAALADRSRFERLAKAIVFMPLAISLVGAGVIWNFVYAYRDPASPQIGLLNAIWTGLGGDPQAWIAQNQPWNNVFLIVIVVWLQTGFAMTIFSAAIKGVAAELLDAGRIDGASELQVFGRIVLPMILPTIITVTTTIVIFTLKIFDVVLVMTGGQYGTNVIATEFYHQYFVNRNAGFGSAIAVVLLVAVIPVMLYNVRQLRDRW
jgi:alpha-glucoside transport system permease protein